jgi:hypothetical protein
MADDQAACLKTVASEHEASFVLRVIWIIDQASILVKENGLRFFERDPVPYQV